MYKLSPAFLFWTFKKKHVEAVSVDPHLDEDCKAVVGIPGSIQIVLVFLGDVWHHHVDQSLHSVMERC